MSNCYDQPPKPKRSPIAVAGDLITRCGDSLDVEAAKLLRDMHGELEELRLHKGIAITALKAIVVHQETVGGGLAVLSTTRLLAQNAINDISEGDDE